MEKGTNLYRLVVLLILQRWRKVVQSELLGKRQEVNCKLDIMLMSQKMTIFLMSHNWMSLGRAMGTSGESSSCATRLPKRSHTQTHKQQYRCSPYSPRARGTLFSMLSLSHTHGRQCPFSSRTEQLKDAAGQTQTDVKHKMQPHLAWRHLI